MVKDPLEPAVGVCAEALVDNHTCIEVLRIAVLVIF